MLQQAGHDEAAAILHAAPAGFYELAAEQKTIIQQGFDAVNHQFDERVAQAKRLGLHTSGNDGYVEFALPPRRTAEQAAADVETLYDLELLSLGQKYPLHMTLGGIATSASTAYLLCSTEIMGNISSERITQKNTWNVKGRGGAKNRPAHELQQGATKGVEFRTLYLASKEQFEVMATTAQVGAKAIQQQRPEWRGWRSTIRTELRAAGLPTDDYWGRFDVTTWQKYGELLADDEWRTRLQDKIGEFAHRLA